jgi:hypothetical protein
MNQLDAWRERVTPASVDFDELLTPISPPRSIRAKDVIGFLKTQSVRTVGGGWGQPGLPRGGSAVLSLALVHLCLLPHAHS